MTHHQAITGRMALYRWRRDGESLWYTPVINHSLMPSVGARFTPDKTGGGRMECTDDPFGHKYITFYKRVHCG
jgi:hypothetical protein